MSLLSNVPTVAQLEQYSVNVSGMYEVNTQSLYDRIPYAVGGQSQALFYQNPVGSIISGVTKTAEDTNMTSAGTLAAPINFLATSVELIYIPGVGVDDVDYINDIKAFANNGSLRFNVGDKTQLTEAPLGVFPPKTCVEVFSSGTMEVAHASMVGRPYFLEVPILLRPSQNFDVRLGWKSPLPMPSGTAGQIICRLDGYRYRLAQ